MQCTFEYHSIVVVIAALDQIRPSGTFMNTLSVDWLIAVHQELYCSLATFMKTFVGSILILVSEFKCLSYWVVQFVQFKETTPSNSIKLVSTDIVWYYATPYNTFFTNPLYFICMYSIKVDFNVCMNAPERSSDCRIFSCNSQRLPWLQRSVATSIDACQETCNCFVSFNRYLPCCHVERHDFQLVIYELDLA